MMTDEEPDRDPHGECRAEIARLTAELAAARAVPADVEAAIDAYEARVTSLVTSMTGRAADDAVAVDVARNNLRAIITRAITEDRAAAPSTVGGLLATAPVGSIVEYLDADGDIWHQVEFNATMTAHRRRIDAWGGWKLRDMPMRELRQRARLVPADQADLDPSTRGPIGEG